MEEGSARLWVGLLRSRLAYPVARVRPCLGERNTVVLVQKQTGVRQESPLDCSSWMDVTKKTGIVLCELLSGASMHFFVCKL